MTTPLTIDALLADARHQAGIDDFGDEWFIDALERLIDAINAQACLSEAGAAGAVAHLTGILVNRLRAERDFKAHPEILEQSIERPLVILGLQRTGTTKLQRMLARDERFQHLALWQAMNFAPFPGCAERAARIEAAVQAERHMRANAPEFFATHPMKAMEAEEETMLVAASFMGTSSESRFDIPGFGTWVEYADHTRAYQEMANTLRYLQWQNDAAGKPWLLKTPLHILHLDALLQALPDARIVHLHRDPARTVPSLCRLLYYLRRISSDAVDAKALGAYWLGRLARGTRRYLSIRAQLPADRFLDLRYEDVVADGVACAGRALAHAGLALTSTVERAMRDWECSNAQHKHGAYSYTAEEYGLEDSEIRAAFAGYIDRFDL